MFLCLCLWPSWLIMSRKKNADINQIRINYRSVPGQDKKICMFIFLFKLFRVKMETKVYIYWVKYKILHQLFEIEDLNWFESCMQQIRISYKISTVLEDKKNSKKSFSCTVVRTTHNNYVLIIMYYHLITMVVSV